MTTTSQPLSSADATSGRVTQLAVRGGDVRDRCERQLERVARLERAVHLHVEFERGAAHELRRRGRGSWRDRVARPGRLR